MKIANPNITISSDNTDLIATEQCTSNWDLSYVKTIFHQKSKITRMIEKLWTAQYNGWNSSKKKKAQTVSKNSSRKITKTTLKLAWNKS